MKYVLIFLFLVLFSCKEQVQEQITPVKQDNPIHKIVDSSHLFGKWNVKHEGIPSNFVIDTYAEFNFKSDGTGTIVYYDMFTKKRKDPIPMYWQLQQDRLQPDIYSRPRLYLGKSFKIDKIRFIINEIDAFEVSPQDRFLMFKLSNRQISIKLTR